MGLVGLTRSRRGNAPAAEQIGETSAFLAELWSQADARLQRVDNVDVGCAVGVLHQGWRAEPLLVDQSGSAPAMPAVQQLTAETLSAIFTSIKNAHPGPSGISQAALQSLSGLSMEVIAASLW